MSLTITKLRTGKLEVTGTTFPFHIDGTALLAKTESGISLTDILGNKSFVSYDDDNVGGVENVVEIDGVINTITNSASLYTALKRILDDASGAEITNFPLTAFGDMRVAELSPVFQQSFEYTVDNTFLTTNVGVDGGTITQADGMAVIGSSITTASTAMMKSGRHAKYRSGLGSLLRFTALFTPGVAATEQYVGLADEAGSSAAFKNGYMIGFDGETFGIHRFQNDVKTTITQANWDDPLDGTGVSGMTIDLTKLNVWEIRFQYLGGGAQTFYVEDDSTGRFFKFHTILYANLNIVPSTYNPNYHATFWVNNKATISDLVIKTSSFSYFIEGKSEFGELHQPQFPSGQKSKTSVTTELAIFTIKNKALYNSKTNFIDIILENLVASIEADGANNLGQIRLVKNATLGGTPSYADINATDSIVEIDVAGTTVIGGTEIFNESLAGKNDKVDKLLLPFKLILAPGDTITVSGISVLSATINSSLLWKELF